MKLMQDELRIKLAPGTNYQSLGGEEDGVLLSMDSGYLYRCNHTALAALEAITDGATFGELVDRFADRYGLPTDRVRDDLSRLVGNLLDEKLIKKAA